MRHVLAAAERAGAKTKLISGSSRNCRCTSPKSERSDGARDLVADSLGRTASSGLTGYHGSISPRQKPLVMPE